MLAYCGAQRKAGTAVHKLELSTEASSGIYRLSRGKAMKAKVKWIDEVRFVVETGSGHALLVDGAQDAGGRNLGPRPMELVLAGTAACTAFDVVWILRKARQPVETCVVEANAERAAEEPKVFTRIHLVYRVSGDGLNPTQVERAVRLSKEKYCSATLMLAKTAEISFEIAIEPKSAP